MGKTWADVLFVLDGALSAIPSGPDIGLVVSVIPAQIHLNQQISVTVHANVLGHPVAGAVKIDGTQVGSTNTPFNYTFVRTKKVMGNTGQYV